MTTSPDAMVYRTAARSRAIAYIGGGAFIVGGMAGIVYFGSGHEAAGPAAMVTTVVISACFALFGIWGVASALRHQVTLAPDSVEQRGLLSTRRMRLNDVEGFRLVNIHGEKILMLLPREGAGKGLDISLSFPLDDPFMGWLAKLTDLNQRDAADMLQRVEQDTLLGDTPASRVKRVTNAHRRANWMTWAAIAAALWAMGFPSPYALALGAAALMPLLAMLLCWLYPDRFTLADDDRKSPRASLQIVVMVPSLALVLRAIFDTDLVDWTVVLIPTLLLGALMALGVGAARGTAASFLMVAGTMALYPAGVLPLANERFDSAAPRRMAATVDAKRHVRDKGDTYYLQLSPWIDRPWDEVRVIAGLYQRVERGGQVCVLVYPGALGMAWYAVADAGRCKLPQ
ncbi:MAG TPA: hypothetical protein VF861_14395 [Telluria sp.]